MSDVTLNLTPQLYDYLLQNSLRETSTLQRLRVKTHEMVGSQMQISPEQGQFMQLLIRLLNAKKTLDIGTFTGYSALVVALALPADGKVITCDVNKEATRVAQQFWQEASVADKIDLRLQPALETLNQLVKTEVGTFDFAFIDADKNNYPDYYELCLQLLRSGGLIAIDNVLWGGSVADRADHDAVTTMFRGLNQKLLHDARIYLSMLPIGDGLTLALKR